MIKLLLYLFILIYTSLTYASSTLYGPTGLITMPSAEAIAYKKISVALDYDLGKRASSNKIQHFYKMNIGTFENCELGVVGGTNPEEGFFVNAKYFLVSDNNRYPVNIAIGLANLGSKDNSGIYLVASKKFEGGLNGHFGFNATFRETLDTSAMLGVEYILDDTISFLGDIIGQNDIYSLNLGARYYFHSDIAFRLSIIDVTQSQSDETILTAGISLAKFI